MTPLVFDANVRDFNLKPLGYLTDCIECTVEEQINDVYELSLKYPVNGLNYDLLQNERLILVKVKDGDSTNYNDPIYQPFSIYKISRPIDQIVTVNAQHVSYLAMYVLYNALQNDESHADQKGIDNLIEMLNDPNNLIPGITNPFTISQEDIHDTTCQYLTGIPKTLRSMIGGDADSIIESLKYEVEFDKYNITFKKKRGQDRGVKIAYSKNLTNFDHTEEMGSVITAILPYYSSGESSAIGQITYAYASDGYKKNRNGVPPFVLNTYYEKKGSTYELLATEPDYWNSRWHTYYELESSDNYINVRPVPISFESGKYYEKDAETGIYSVLMEEPSDWNTNYTVYYEKYHMDSIAQKYRQLSNRPPIFNNDVFYKKTSAEDDTNEVFELVETEPPDWDTTWPNYYYYWYDETSKYSLKYHSNHIATSDVSSSFSEAPTNQEFMSFYAREYMKKEKTYKPKISMTVSFISLWQTPEYSNIAPLEYVSIGDTVHVYFPAYNIFTEARVNKVIYDVITEQYESLDLGEPSEGFAESSVEAKIDTKDIIRNTARDLSTAYDKGIRKAIAEFGKSTGSYVSLNQDSDGRITSITVSDTPTITEQTGLVVTITAAGIGFWAANPDDPADHYDPDKLTGIIGANGLTIPATTTGTLNADRCNVTNIKAENIIVRDPNRPQDVGTKYSEYINVEPGKITIGSPEAQVKMVSLADRLVFVDTQVLENIPMALRGYNAYDIPKFISNYYLGNTSEDDDAPVWQLLMSKPADWDIPPEEENSPWRSETHDSEKYKRRKVYAYISDNVFYTNEIRVQNTERVGRFQKYIRSDNSLVMVRGG